MYYLHIYFYLYKIICLFNKVIVYAIFGESRINSLSVLEALLSNLQAHNNVSPVAKSYILCEINRFRLISHKIFNSKSSTCFLINYL